MTLTETNQKPIGWLVVEHSAFRKQLDANRATIEITISRKDITGVSAALHDGVRRAGGRWAAELAVRGRLVPVARITTGAVTAIRETSPYQSPDLTGVEVSVAEGAAKPEVTGGTWDDVTETVKTFAVTFKISRQALDDLDFLATMITQRYEGALLRRIDREIIAGAGGALHFNGILPQAAAAAAGTSTLNAIGIAYSALADAGYVPDGIVFSASDFGKLVAANALGLPSDFNAQTGTFWGMRMAAISGSTMAGQFLIGAFAENSILLEREEVNSEVAMQNENDLIHNLATVRIEERSAFFDLQPNAFLKGAIGATPV